VKTERVNLVICDSTGYVNSVCNLVYLLATNSRVDCSLSWRISYNPVCTSHDVTFIPQDQATQIPSLLPIILKISGGRYNLWSYISCSFLQFPITFNQKKSEDWSALFPNPVYSLSSVSQTKCHTHKRKYYINTHVYISIVILLASRKKCKTLWSCCEHYSKLISSQLLVSAIFIP
jgi:hypothetical protein